MVVHGAVRVGLAMAYATCALHTHACSMNARVHIAEHAVCVRKQYTPCISHSPLDP